MQLQDQVISLEQAKKLKELWFSKLCWFHYMKQDDNEFDIETAYDWIPVAMYWDTETYPAYTASELMDILPDTIEHKDYWNCKLNIVKRWAWYDVKYSSDLWWHVFSALKLTIALGETLIYLLENNLLPTTQSND